MNYPIPANLGERANQQRASVDEDVVAAAIAGVIHSARAKGQSLEDLRAEILADDCLLKWEVRCLLSEILEEAWNHWPDSLQ